MWSKHTKVEERGKMGLAWHLPLVVGAIMDGINKHCPGYLDSGLEQQTKSLPHMKESLQWLWKPMSTKTSDMFYYEAKFDVIRSMEPTVLEYGPIFLLHFLICVKYGSLNNK